ncbi:MAG: hydrogenase maturation protease [Candidatus Thermoplasmatota archaeon]
MPRSPKPSHKRAAIIGIGNPLMGDDGAGISVLDIIRGSALPEGVEVIDMGTGGFSLLHLLAELDTAIIVDAVDFGGAPGEVTTFTPSDVRSAKPCQGLSLHEGDVMKVVSLAQQLGQCPKRVVICAIQPAEIAPGRGLSTWVKEHLPLLAELSLEEARRAL